MNEEQIYKYSCRDCTIRDRCIAQSDTAARVKEMIRNAFAARTDTLSTWGVLQKNCLLIKEEEVRQLKTNRESLLSQRLREARGETSGSAEESLTQQAGPPFIPPPGVTPEQGSEPEPDSPIIIVPGKIPVPAVDESPITAIETTPAAERNVPRRGTAPLPSRVAVSNFALPSWLTVRGSNRHIALPVTCQLVLGRFDPGLSDPPDIDLTYEDQRFLTVSRRHAKIIGANGRFTVKDLGSSNGVFLNDEPVTLGFSRQFEPGDIVRLGYLQLRYDLMPTELLDPAKAAQFQHFLLVAFTGRRQLIAPPDHVLIGRAGSQVNLSQAGDAAERVSDRHALITWHNNSPYLEDLGSSQGTRLNGEPVLAGQSIPLRPGDHIWLGGCVLAYDVRRQATGLNQPPGQSN